MQRGQVEQGSGEGSRKPLVQSQVRFKRVPEKVPEKVLEKVQESLVESQLRFNRVPEKVPDSGEGLGGFGAEPGHVEGFRIRFW